MLKDGEPVRFDLLVDGFVRHHVLIYVFSQVVGNGPTPAGISESCRSAMQPDYELC